MQLHFSAEKEKKTAAKTATKQAKLPFKPKEKKAAGKKKNPWESGSESDASGCSAGEEKQTASETASKQTKLSLKPKQKKAGKKKNPWESGSESESDDDFADTKPADPSKNVAL